MAASEAHIQAIGRFIVGFGTEEDPDWRDYHFDFCGTIDYGQDGVPTTIHPKDKSGYSLGSMQLDFGQTTAAADPFISAFEAWANATPGALPLLSSHQAAVASMTMDGPALSTHPAKGLRRQDVDALTAYVRSPAGSEWVNIHIDNELIGSDVHTRISYNDEFTQVGIARQVEASTSFQKYDGLHRSDMTDLLYAMTMKCYNQAPTVCTETLLPFLNTDPEEADVIAWPNRFRNALKTGVGSAIANAKFFTWLMTPSHGYTPPQWVFNLKAVMETLPLANPRSTATTNAAYVAAKLAFEECAVFRNFVKAVISRTDYIPEGYFDPATGKPVIKTIGLIHEGVLVKSGIGYVWDTAGNAFRLANGAWTNVPIASINSKMSILDRVRTFARSLFATS
jgi:hypothetical protein